jgi:hypothetical protein
MVTKRTSNPFSAKVTLGLERGYTQAKIDRQEIIRSIQNYQNRLIAEKQFYLSISISDCQIVLGDHIEPHLQLHFINYPKFPQPETILKSEIENLTQHLMKEFDQNRVVVEYPDETVMFEVEEEVDPRIKK